MDSTEQSGDSKSSIGRTILREIWSFIRVFLLAAVIILPIRYFIAQPFIVKGASMEPTFQNYNYLFIDEASYYFRSPARGEVVVFRYPLDPSQYYIKRVIGLPGERVIITQGNVKIEDAGGQPEELDESYLPKDLVTLGEVNRKLGPTEYFVLGDNRTFSSDSRRWGPLDRKFITGRVALRAWPFSEFGVVTTPQYAN